MKKPTSRLNQEPWQGILENIGLSEKETLIYITLLENGEMLLSRLAQKAGLKRGIVYELTKRLVTLNLVTVLEGSFGRIAQAQSPENLLELAKEQEKNASSIKNQIESIFQELKETQKVQAVKPRVSYNLGVDALRIPLRNMLHDKPTETIYVRASSHNPKVKPEQLDFVKAKAKAKIKTLSISQDTTKNRAKLKTDVKNSIDRKFIGPEEYNSPMDINIYNNKTSFTNQNKLISITIEDQDIAEAMRQILIALRKRL